MAPDRRPGPGILLLLPRLFNLPEHPFQYSLNRRFRRISTKGGSEIALVINLNDNGVRAIFLTRFFSHDYLLLGLVCYVLMD
jgi:hypothetical protein